MKTQPPPAIALIPTDGKPRPFWSVMIPTYNPQSGYLEATLRSVLAQDPGADQMQIEVVDDCSPGMDVVALVRQIAGDRVVVFRSPLNKGLAGCWNTCIERSRGRWVHILHQDDYVLPGFYKTLARASELHPEVSLLATRSFFIDKQGVIFSVTERLRELENGGRVINGFFYTTPILFPGVVVKRTFYEAQGGFRSDLSFVLDCEMWTRVISSAGGLVTSEVLSCYRMSSGNETTRLLRTGECLRDIERLNLLFAGRFPEFDSQKATRRLCDLAIEQAERFARNGDKEAAQINLVYWKHNAPFKRRFLKFAMKLARNVFG